MLGQYYGGCLSLCLCLKVFAFFGKWIDIGRTCEVEDRRKLTSGYFAHRPSSLFGSRYAGRGPAGRGTSCYWHLCCRR